MQTDLNLIGRDIIGASFDVHNFLGRFLLEKVYEQALAIELRNRGYKVETQVPIQITYKGSLLPAEAYKADLIVNDLVIIELKAHTTMPSEGFRQLMSYLVLANKKLGYLINFGAESLKIGTMNDLPDLSLGIYRIVNNI